MEAILLFLVDHFPDLMDINLTASIVIAFVLCVRQFLKRAPKIFSYALWAVVLLRLLVPVSIESPMSVVPERTEFSSMVEVNEVLPEIQFETPQDRADNEWRRENTATGEPLVQAYRSMDAETYLTFAWLIGIAVMLIHSGVSYWKLRRKVRVAVPLRKGIFIADDIETPFVMGVFRPVIYLPGTLDPSERKYIIAHEQHHIRRGDHIFKALGFLALTIHWFNPLVWVAFVLAGRDMEMSCDEAVIRKLGEDVRAEYSASLLNLATGQRLFAGTPLAFGEGDPTGRVRNLAKWKKPAFWVILICLILCAALAVCLLTDPETKLPFMDDYHEVLSAELVDMREQETVRRTFSEAERKELGYRLRDLDRIEKYTEPNSIIPIYILDLEIQNIIGEVSISCVSWEEDQALLRYNDTEYWIRDKEFLSYLKAACDQDYITSAQEINDWGVSLVPDRVSRTGATALFSYDGNAELTYGDYLSLERLVNGDWVACDELAGFEYYVGDSSYPVVDGYGMVHEWQDRFGELADGHYRIGKLVTRKNSDGTSEDRMIYGAFSIPDSILTGPIPLEELPEIYGAEQAMIDGCFVQTDGVARENKELFREFAENAWNGIPGLIRLYNCSYSEGFRWSAVDLSYDGNVYTLTSQYSIDGNSTYTYRYLKHFTGEKAWENADHDAFEYYILVNDDSITWQDISGGRLNDQEGGLAHWTVYADFTYLPETPQLPENLTRAVLEFEGEPMVTITDFDRLEKIFLLFSNAEILGYEPKTHSIGVGLNLVLTAENGEIVTIELDPDNDLCRIYGEYVFYGAPEEPCYITKLWEYLGLHAWPEFLYELCPNACKHS